LVTLDEPDALQDQLQSSGAKEHPRSTGCEGDLCGHHAANRSAEQSLTAHMAAMTPTN